MQSHERPASEPPAVVRRSPWAAALLSLLLPGLGQAYGGRGRRGAVFLVVFAAILAWLAYGPGGARLRLVAGLIGLAAAVALAAAADAARLARRGRDTAAGRLFGRWPACILAIAAGWLVIVLVPRLAPWPDVRALYYAASAGMQPALRRDESFLVDKTWYRTHPPARGDLAVYAHPHRPDRVEVKRIVALPGDSIAVNFGRAVIDGAPAVEPYAVSGDPLAFSNTVAETKVPEGHVYVLGDNRMNSEDSRAERYGPVPLANLIGRATDIAWSQDLRRVGTWIGSPAAP